MAVDKKGVTADSIYETLPSADDVLLASLSRHKQSIESLLKGIAERITTAACAGERSASVHLGSDISTLLADTAVEALGARGYSVETWLLPRERGMDLNISW